MLAAKREAQQQDGLTAASAVAGVVSAATDAIANTVSAAQDAHARVRGQEGDVVVDADSSSNANVNSNNSDAADSTVESDTNEMMRDGPVSSARDEVNEKQKMSNDLTDKLNFFK